MKKTTTISQGRRTYRSPFTRVAAVIVSSPLCQSPAIGGQTEDYEEEDIWNSSN